MIQILNNIENYLLVDYHLSKNFLFLPEIQIFILVISIFSLFKRTTDESLKEYVTKFGEVSDSLVMKDQNGQSRCFGFVTFTDPQSLEQFMQQRPHTLDGRQIDPKRASRDSEKKTISQKFHSFIVLISLFFVVFFFFF